MLSEIILLTFITFLWTEYTR